MTSQCCLQVDLATLVSGFTTMSLSLAETASFLKKIWWLPSVNSAGAHITNIVLTAKGQIFWAQLTQTSRCFMIQFSRHFFSVWTAVNVSCSQPRYHLAFSWREYIIYKSPSLLFSHLVYSCLIQTCFWVVRSRTCSHLWKNCIQKPAEIIVLILNMHIITNGTRLIHKLIKV